MRKSLLLYEVLANTIWDIHKAIVKIKHKDKTNPDTCLLHIIHEANINKIEIQWFEMNKQICFL